MNILNFQITTPLLELSASKLLPSIEDMVTGNKYPPSVVNDPHLIALFL